MKNQSMWQNRRLRVGWTCFRGSTAGKKAKGVGGMVIFTFFYADLWIVSYFLLPWFALRWDFLLSFYLFTFHTFSLCLSTCLGCWCLRCKSFLMAKDRWGFGLFLNLLDHGTYRYGTSGFSNFFFFSEWVGKIRRKHGMITHGQCTFSLVSVYAYVHLCIFTLEFVHMILYDG